MSNEEKILAILEKHGEMLEKHGEMLEKHGEMLEKHGEMLAKMDRRMDRMDQRMDRMEERIDQIDERSQRTAVLMESDMAPKLRLLYEGHGAIMDQLDKLATKSRVEVLETDVALLKDVVKLMRQEIAELKKAQ